MRLSLFLYYTDFGLLYMLDILGDGLQALQAKMPVDISDAAISRYLRALMARKLFKESQWADDGGAEEGRHLTASFKLLLLIPPR